MGRVEETAESLLNRLNCKVAPVDPAMIARSLGIVVREEPFDGDLSGVLMRTPDQVFICANVAHHPNRKRFTIAHELGHFALGHKGDMFVDEMVFNKRDGRSSIAIDPKEIEANAFAAALLMPRSLVLDELRRLRSMKRADDADAVATELASIFQVSVAAMNFRLANLGLIAGGL